MRPSARELNEAINAYSRAIRVTPPLIQRLTVAVAQDLANEMGGAVRIILPGGIVIERGPQDTNVKDARTLLRA
ncbi:hypothetical protein [Paraburkholderia sp. C35]|uniref:hypothetical protein n=1 Tax=Paraburkholderia sp. C35 TaxID=2126993 RepID=UPI0013A59B0E|nr:hypothetical protein [Paraburkholderia sp. C35]